MIIKELMLHHAIFVYFFLTIFYLAVGSLLNVFIHRLPKMLQAEWRQQCHILLNLPEPESSHYNLFFPRSSCPHCHHVIPIWQNIPLLSFCLLRGRCAFCATTIPFRYFLVELLCAGLSLYATWHFGLSLSLIFALLFIWIVIIIIFIDLKHQLIPDNLSLTLLWIGLIANTQTLFIPLSNAVLSAAIAYLSLWLFINLYFLLTGKIGMGHGDFKLFAAFGAWFGWIQLPLILLLSSVVGAITGLIYLKKTKQTSDTPIPYGPFLCAAALISLFYGSSLIHWYLYSLLVN